MQGIYINGDRPKSKKAIRDAVRNGFGDLVIIESTSLNGGEWAGRLTDIPAGRKVYFAGPDPYTSRRFYGVIERSGDKVTVR